MSQQHKQSYENTRQLRQERLTDEALTSWYSASGTYLNGADAKLLIQEVWDQRAQLSTAQAEIERLRADRKWLRVRLFANRKVDGSSHSTGCSIWGDNGQGGTEENFPEPLPCNCGALENFANSQIEKWRTQTGSQTPEEAGARIAQLKAAARAWLEVSGIPESLDCGEGHYERAEAIREELESLVQEKR